MHFCVYNNATKSEMEQKENIWKKNLVKLNFSFLCVYRAIMFQWTTLHSESHANTESVDFTADTVYQRNDVNTRLNHNNRTTQHRPVWVSISLVCTSISIEISFHSHVFAHTFDVVSLSNTRAPSLRPFILIRWIARSKRHSTEERRRDREREIWEWVNGQRHLVQNYGSLSISTFEIVQFHSPINIILQKSSFLELKKMDHKKLKLICKTEYS